MIISRNGFLSLDEMKVNAQYILDKLVANGWTSNAICAMLGNMQTESTINPGIWENLAEGDMTGGFGLVQWTPASKFTNWADSNNFQWTNIDGQIARIEYEKTNHIQWNPTDTYPLTFEEFSKSTDTPYNLALMFLTNYERPLHPDQPNRGDQANYWYQTLTLNPIPTQRKKMPLWFYLKKV
jgi:hypothetical protein